MRFPKEAVVNFINSRAPREKKMMLILAVGIALFVDFWIFVYPGVALLGRTLPGLSTGQQELNELREDKKNHAMIEKKAKDVQEKLEGMEKRFVGVDETPVLLENLSKLALDSGIKITSLKPIEGSAVQNASSYSTLPIQIDAIGGAHECGQFLSSLENNQTLFRLTDMKISENSQDPRRHLLWVKLEAFRRK